MAKSSYNQRASISRSRLDHVISTEVWGIRIKPIPVKIYLFWFGVLFFLMWLVTKSPVSASPVWLLILIAIWVIATGAYLGTQMKTGELRFTQVPTLIKYFEPGERSVKTRRTSEPYDFMSIVGIRDIDETGMLYFLDGSVGKAYGVVGSASRLVFDRDRAHMVNRVDAFWRKVDTTCEWLFITTKEPQRVFRQVAHAERQNKAIIYDDPGLRELREEKYAILTEDVGGRFNSIHQYLIIKAKNDEDLQAAHSLLASEVESSSLMFKQCIMLDEQATVDMLGAIYHHRSTSEEM